MWIGTAAVKFEGLYCSAVKCPNEAVDPIGAVFALHFFQKLFIVLALGLTLTLAFYPLRRMFGKKYAFITMLLLSFEPFFYALTRVIHLEALMTSFMLTSFIWLFYTLETSREEKTSVKLSGLILSAIMAGLSVLSKSTAVFMLPFSLLAILLYQGKHLKTCVKTSAIWLAPVVLTYVILWPSMWIHPLTTLDYVFIRGIKETGLEGEHTQLYFGNVTDNPGPLYYFAVMAFKFSPILITGIVFFALFFKKILAQFNREKAGRFTVLILIFTLGYLLEIILPTKKLDRYVLPALGSLCLLAGFAYVRLVDIIGKFSCRSRIWVGAQPEKGMKLVLYTLFLIALAYQSLSLTPDYFSYYNPMFGGLAKGVFILEPKWIIGQHQVAQYFSALMQTNKLEPFAQGQSFDNQKDLSNKLTVAFPEKYYTQIWPFIRKIGGWATIEDLSPNARKTTYFVYPVWDDYSAQEKRFKLTYVDSVYLRGVRLYNIYQRYAF